jgi:uncharacterized protein YjbJ (UPF0337 family)
VQIGTIDLNKLRGLSDKALGLLKEAAGELTGNDRLQDEGEAQQERASAELKALRAELRAQKEDTKAEALDARERAAQRAKAS